MTSPSMEKLVIGGVDYQIPAAVIEKRKFYITEYDLDKEKSRAVFSRSERFSHDDAEQLKQLIRQQIMELPVTAIELFVILHADPIPQGSSFSDDKDSITLEDLAKGVDHGDYALLMAPAQFVSQAVQGNEEASNRFRQGESWRNINKAGGNAESMTLTSSDVATV